MNSHFIILSWILLGREPKPSPSHTRGDLDEEARLLWEESKEMRVDACWAMVAASVDFLSCVMPSPLSLPPSALANVGTPFKALPLGSDPPDTAWRDNTRNSISLILFWRAKIIHRAIEMAPLLDPHISAMHPSLLAPTQPQGRIQGGVLGVR